MMKKITKSREVGKGCDECQLSNAQSNLIELKKNLKRTKNLRIAIVGHPNSGKSTFFNSLSNYKVNTANYAGTTVEYHVTTIFIKNYSVELIDLPGMYSLNYSDLAEKVSFEILTNMNEQLKIDGIIQVVEAVSLPHSLLLTLDLLTLDLPMVIALNMFDEARVKGVRIDIDGLQKILSIPVIPTIAIKGENTLKTLLALIDIIEKNKVSFEDYGNIVIDKDNIFYQSSFSKEELPDVIKAYKRLWKNMVEDIFKNTNCHLENCKLIPACLMNIEKFAPNLKSLSQVRDEILKLKSNIIMSISASTFSYSKPSPTFDDLVDRIILHRFWGYGVLIFVLFSAFFLAYFVGSFLANSMVKLFDPVSSYIDSLSKGLGIWQPLVVGLKDGIFGGLGIVIPYLIPFLLFIALLEDSGYIPRMMYLMDNFLKNFGISGRSVLSFVLGLGCNVSAIMSLRGLTKYNERIIAGMVIPFVPCSARTVVIMALVTGVLGVFWGLTMYLISLIVISLVLLLINKVSKIGISHFMVHIPPYRVPSLRSVFIKIWLKFKAFVYSAWPILILGTIVLNYFSYLGWDKIINSALSFLTVGLLGLPEQTGIPLIFGVLAKEYALVMLYSAFNTENIKAVMNNAQIFVFSVFILLYTPCISTIAVQVREIGWKYTIISILMSVSTAILVSFLISKILFLNGGFLK